LFRETSKLKREGVKREITHHVSRITLENKRG